MRVVGFAIRGYVQRLGVARAEEDATEAIEDDANGARHRSDVIELLVVSAHRAPGGHGPEEARRRDRGGNRSGGHDGLGDRNDGLGDRDDGCGHGIDGLAHWNRGLAGGASLFHFLFHRREFLFTDTLHNNISKESFQDSHTHGIYPCPPSLFVLSLFPFSFW